MEIGSKPILELVIDSNIVANGSIEEYHDKVVGFSRKNGVDLDETLSLITKGFFWKEGVGHVEGFALVFKCFEIHRQIPMFIG
jgi:hypothetical protein